MCVCVQALIQTKQNEQYTELDRHTIQYNHHIF